MYAPLYRLLLVSTLLFAPFQVYADHCEVSKISIIAGPWENTSSRTSYTIQAQDQSGASCHAAQTLRLSFISSGNGTFVGQTGNAVQTFISTNSANRNFYYDNSTGEHHDITVSAGYGTASDWVVAFSTTHNTANSFTSVDDDDEVNPQPSTKTQTTTPTPSSSHYVSTPVTTVKHVAKLEVGAGRTRLGTVGTPMEFKAETKTENTRSSQFRWSMGDGSTKSGPVIAHSYEYPGDYVVVLNMISGDDVAVARTLVRIVEDSLSVSYASPSRIEVSNGSKSEVNLYGRALVAQGKMFVFPQDTIILGGQKLSFSSGITGVEPVQGLGVRLVVVGDDPGRMRVIMSDETEKLEHIAQLQVELAELQQKLAVLVYEERSQQARSQPRVVVATDEPVVMGVGSREDVVEQTGLVQSALVLSAVERGNTTGRMKWFDVIKSFFMQKNND
jgi:hypothetical protein